MMNSRKGFVKGFVLSLIVVLLLTSVASGSSFKDVIEVVFNSVNLTVNGEEVEADTILYKGTTYVPLRAAGKC